MAKRKNPLKDLDAFLKQEAKNVVQPNTVSEAPVATPSSEVATPPQAPVAITEEVILNYIANIKDPKALYTLMQQAVEKSTLNTAENKMLLNTLLYLQDKDHWKENITAYWS